MRVLFVCLGNICRSPIAEGILRKLAAEANLDWTIESAGTNQWHKGGPADPRSESVCREFGVDISRHIARRFHADDFAKFDRIYSLAADVTAEMAEFAKSHEDTAKILNFMDHLPGEKGRSVPDPWYGDESHFKESFALIERGCRALIDDFRRLNRER